MIKLQKLYSKPEIFKPIFFESGINLILGEKVSEDKALTHKDKKTNGVGKSMCVEFINFCLLKEESKSRVSQIPLDKISHSTTIKLDLIIGDVKLTISRNLAEPDKPVIDLADNSISFLSIDDATGYLDTLFKRSLVDSTSESPSFRELMGPLIRDERSNFQDIVNCYDLKQKVPYADQAKTHLYFFGLDPSSITELKKLNKKIEERAKTYSYLKNKLTEDGKKKIKDIKAELNAVEGELKKAEVSLNKFESDPMFQLNQNALVSLESNIDLLRQRQIVLKTEIRRIELLPKMEHIDLADIEIVFNRFKDGLGGLVVSSLDQVISFKKKIESYQTTLTDNKLKDLRRELSQSLVDLRDLDLKRSQLLSGLDNSGLLKDLKNSFTLYNKRKEEISASITNLANYETAEREIDNLKTKKSNTLSVLNSNLFESSAVIKFFEKTLIGIHEYIMGNSGVSFSIDAVSGKDIVELDLRIDDDGSHSVDRTKIFIYDTGLMFNEFTMKKHPQFLIHDNIFDVDQDTLVRSLNYLAEQEEKGYEFQYILTLNRDKISMEEQRNEINLDIDKHTRASFTRQEKFLGVSYQEEKRMKIKK